jgi:hypothetical protein
VDKPSSKRRAERIILPFGVRGSESTHMIDRGRYWSTSRRSMTIAASVSFPRRTHDGRYP